MRYRLTQSPQSKRAQVMTPPHLASRLMDFLSGTQDAWLELGAGTGHIMQACMAKRLPREYVGVEIDANLLANLPPHRNARYIQGDVLAPAQLASLLGNQTFSRTTGNPPYGMEAMTDECQQRVAELCPGIPQVASWVQLDLYFILESLARLRRPGEAAFIVGAPIAEDSRLAAFRRELVAAASEIECFELPKNVFDSKAEVQSYLLVARFGQSKLRRVRLGRIAGSNLDIVAVRYVSPIQASQRMDLGHYEFEEWNRSLQSKAGACTLSELGATVVRGSRTRTQFAELSIECFHTTDFPTDIDKVRFGLDQDHGFQSAITGDILLPRVGTRCLDRQALVIRGHRHYTEAVYRLRIPNRSHKRVADWVMSRDGALWRQAAAKGSCAKHVTVASLLAMPVPTSGYER